ncbi:MAG TPA: urea amidolyase associated protein UAAP1 [Candidatus Dormibacteraeota bacterium]|nr:urea amidolyase associated protein UAAP1 [Candidatus Dormibacteraeota bacterium]
MNETPVLWQEAIQPGASWSHVLKRGTALRVTDLEGGSNVGGIFYNFECPVERYNMPDTLKAQHIARLTSGFVLYSDMGRILLSITADTVGWHDPIGGTSNRQLVEARYGPSSYQQERNDYHKNGRDSFEVELGKWGLGPRDLAANVNLFSRVDVADDGSMSFAPGNSKAGDYIDLRAEMNVLVILNTCQHPLDPNPKYQPKPVQVSIRQVAAAGIDDSCRISCPENGRGFTLTERYFM